MYKLHTRCRACGWGPPINPGNIKSGEAPQKLIPIFNLGIQPLSNDFCKEGEEHAGFAPLEVLYCPKCSLAQLSVVVRPDILYSKYNYVTSSSLTMQSHFKSLVDDILHEQPAGSAVEIGSNDGRFMDYLRSRDFGNVVGIDPAQNIKRKEDTATIVDFFNESSAKLARTMTGGPSLVIARHVFCHIDDWHGFIRNLDVLCVKDTLVCIEVPWALDMMGAGSFDQIYFEHLSYFTMKAMRALVADSGFRIHRVCHYPIHGGCLLVMLRRSDSTIFPHDTGDWEDNITEADWHFFAAESVDLRNRLCFTVKELRNKGKTVVGYGASAKSTVWINYCGFTRKDIRFLCDNTPFKQWTTSPGSDIPVVDDGALTRELPDYAICFSWNYFYEINLKEKLFANHGGKWIVPIPNMQII